jgi:hypothetical protein
VGDPAKDKNITDAVVEAIPQRILSLLRVGQPRFVVWAYGQSLAPASKFLGSGPNNNIVTNYQITGDALTRTVFRVDRDTNNVPKIVIENFNVMSGE